MKKAIMSIIFMIVLKLLSIDANTQNVLYERVFIFKMIAFSSRYEVFCTKEINGYYKYPRTINGQTVYLTYETGTFFDQCLFDEHVVIFPEFYPSNLWSLSNGQVVRLKKKYGPVIDKNKERKGYPHSFGKN